MLGGSTPTCDTQKYLQMLPNDPRGTEVFLVANHCVNMKIIVSAITILKKSMWDPEKARKWAYPYNDPFGDVGRQQIELALASSMQSDHRPEVSNSEIQDQRQHIREQRHNLCDQMPPAVYQCWIYADDFTHLKIAYLKILLLCFKLPLLWKEEDLIYPLLVSVLPLPGLRCLSCSAVSGESSRWGSGSAHPYWLRSWALNTAWLTNTCTVGSHLRVPLPRVTQAPCPRPQWRGTQ